MRVATPRKRDPDYSGTKRRVLTPQVSRLSERKSKSGGTLHEADDGGILVTKALKYHGLWLALAYVGLLLLMARTYA